MRLATFDDWARAHHGVITLEASGLSTSAWYRAIAAGTLDQIHPHVARLVGTSSTPEQRIIAGVLALGDGVMASHRSAARLWGLPRPDHDPVDLISHPTRRDPELDGVIVHRTTDAMHLRPHKLFGIRCTNLLRTLVDLGAVDPQSVSGAVGHVLAKRLADLDALEATVVQHAKQGRAGIGALRSAIDEWSIDAKPADSILEAAMYRLVDTYHLPPVEFHPTIKGWEVDFRVIGTPVLLECDGWAYHGLDRVQFERDRERDATLVGAGWIVVRFTYRSITVTPGRTARRIMDAIDRWSEVAVPDAPTPDAA